MRRLIVSSIVAALLLAGCSEAPEPVDSTDTDDGIDRMDIVGSVRDADLRPLPGNVTLEEAGQTIATDSSGDFRFEGLPVDFYTLTAHAPDHLPQTLTATPGTNKTLIFTLAKFSQQPSHETIRFEGRMQCAAEYIIVAGACDRLVTEFGVDPVFQQTSIFDVSVGSNWQSVVVDVVFEGQPGLDGLRVTAKGINQRDNLGTYDDYGKFHDSQSFTFRLEPGGTYDGGDLPVPTNATTLRFDVFGQGHGWHAACVPDPAPQYGGDCFLGLGAGIDVTFEMFVTTFLVEPAPPSFTIR